MAANRMALELILASNHYEIIGSAHKAETAFNELMSVEVDLVLIDINLAGQKDGIWLASKIRSLNLNTAIIFLTAHCDDETITNLLHTNPNGYIMKPYNEPTLLTTIKIAFENQFNKIDPQIIKLNLGFKSVNINSMDIYYIHSEGNYIQFEMKDNFYLVRDKLDNILKKLPNDMFIKVHQRYIINMAKIEKATAGEVEILNKVIPISRVNRNLFKESYNLF